MEFPQGLFNIYNIAFILCVFLLFLVVGYIIWRATRSSLNSPYKNISNNSVLTADGNQQKGPIDIYLFYATWCPHCKTALPKWKEFSDSVNGTIINGCQITTHTIDCTDSLDPNVASYLSKFGIKGFPTVKGVVGGLTINFDTAINKNTLTQFATQLSEP